MEPKKVIAVFLALLILVSCGSSTITLTNNKKPYNIYVNKVNKGTSNVKVQRAGLPQKMTVDVKDAQGNIIAHEVIRRDFNLLQFGVGIIGSVYMLWPLCFWSWKYDKHIEIFVPQQKSEWDTEPAKSKWD
jgi:hypothetical protein